MGSDTKFGTFEELIGTRADEVKKISMALKRVILEVHPEAVEVVRLGDNAACFGIGPKKMSEAHTYVMPLKDRANLGFFYGATLEDPLGLLEGTGKKLRHIKVKTLEQANSAGVRALIEAALSERRETLGL